MVRRILAVVFLIAAGLPLAAQSNAPAPFIQPLTEAAAPLSLRLLPALGYMSGTYYDPYSMYYYTYSGLEGALWGSAQYTLPFLPFAYVGIDAGGGTTNGLVLGAKLGAEYGWRLMGIFDLSLFAQLGVWYVTAAVAADIIPSAGFDLAYRLSPNLSVGMNTSVLLSLSGFSEVMAGVSLTYRIGFGGPSTASPQAPSQPAESPPAAEQPVQPAPLQVPEAAPSSQPPAQPAPLSTALVTQDVTIDSLFPVFYKYYDDHSLGTVRLKNGAASRISDLKVTFWVKQFMDAPKQAAGPGTLDPGAGGVFLLYGIFTDKVLEINEATKAQAQIEISYTLDSKPQSQSLAQTIRILDRNAMTWEDDRRAAAFISSKDPGVMSFAKRVAGIVKGGSNPSLNLNLQIAFAMHEALTLYRISYVKDPKTASISAGKKKEQPDFLQFPRQTLEYKSGDCDDLTILYCSLFESVGIDTAFITIPGHIYMAVSPDMSAAEARASFSRADNLIIRREKVWIPIEVTDRSDFVTAWQLGAREWRENLSRGQANLYETREAWQLFEPAGLSGSGPAVQFPSEEKLASVFTGLFTRWVETEISASVAAIQAQVSQTKGSPKSLNSLGVLFAKYGLTARAETQFQKALEKEPYVPSLLNMGNIAYGKGDREAALGYWEKAYAQQPKNAHVLLSLARASHDLENYFAVKKYYGELKKQDSSLAERFAYLDLKGEEAARAADISGARSVLLWEE